MVEFERSYVTVRFERRGLPIADRHDQSSSSFWRDYKTAGVFPPDAPRLAYVRAAENNLELGIVPGVHEIQGDTGWEFEIPLIEGNARLVG